MSDWGATHSISINAGLDQEMPSGIYMGAPLAAAVAAGNVSVDKVDDSVVRMLTSMFQVGIFDIPNTGNFMNNVSTPEHSHWARVLATQGLILLQNHPVARINVPTLPLPTYLEATGLSVFRIAVVGRHAHTLPIPAGGGSGGVSGPYVITVWQALALRFNISLAAPDCDAQIQTFETGVLYSDTQPLFPVVQADNVVACGQLCVAKTDCNFFSYFASTQDCRMFETNENRVAHPDVTSGTCRMDGTWQCNSVASGQQQVCIALIDGYTGDNVAEYIARADLSMAVVGMLGREGRDRATLALDQDQDKLIDIVIGESSKKETPTPIVVVMTSPGAQLTPWRDHVSAILLNFFTGQEHGLPILDVMMGDVAPSGRLPLTFPNIDNEMQWTPTQYPGVNNVSIYTEKLNVGCVPLSFQTFCFFFSCGEHGFRHEVAHLSSFFLYMPSYGPSQSSLAICVCRTCSDIGGMAPIRWCPLFHLVTV